MIEAGRLRGSDRPFRFSGPRSAASARREGWAVERVCVHRRTAAWVGESLDCSASCLLTSPEATVRSFPSRRAFDVAEHHLAGQPGVDTLEHDLVDAHSPGSRESYNAVPDGWRPEQFHPRRTLLYWLCRQYVRIGGGFVAWVAHEGCLCDCCSGPPLDVEGLSSGGALDVGVVWSSASIRLRQARRCSSVSS